VQNSGQLLILAVFVAFAVWVLSRGRRQQRETQLTQSRVRPGAEVMMTSGVYGIVVDLPDDATIRLETSPGTISRWDRRAVARIITAPGESEGAGGEPPALPADELPPAPSAEPAAHVETARPADGVAPPERD
jgi:preprotein translocase subunit YajC